MDPNSQKPFRIFVNPLMLWTDLAFKTGQAMLASAHAVAGRSHTAAKVAVIPTADAPAPPVRQASKAVRLRTTRAKLRSKATAKRRARR